jgi:type II secretory ATPase GspE/PulE/Tfp pilus assembly ATPase PilB-like protein
MGIERSLVAYALNGSISKRLIRRSCTFCKTSYRPDAATLEYFGLDPAGEYSFIKGAGCEKCGKTGFKGRIGIFEIMEVDDALRSLIMEKVPMSALNENVAKSGVRTLKQDVIEKATAGHTTLEEAITIV